MIKWRAESEINFKTKHRLISCQQPLVIEGMQALAEVIGRKGFEGGSEKFMGKNESLPFGRL